MKDSEHSGVPTVVLFDFWSYKGNFAILRVFEADLHLIFHICGPDVDPDKEQPTKLVV